MIQTTEADATLIDRKVREVLDRRPDLGIDAVRELLEQDPGQSSEDVIDQLDRR